MNNKLWFLFCAAVLAAAFILSISAPLWGDEGIYSISIKDIMKNGFQPYPTYFGEQMYWKPFLMFNAYAIAIKPLYGMIADRVLFRIPSLLLLIASTAMLVKIFEGDLQKTEIQYAIIIFLVSLPVFAYSIKVITDTLAFAMVISALYATKMYVETQKKGFIAMIAVFVLLAGLSKSFHTLFLPIALSVAYSYFKTRKIDSQLVLVLAIAMVIYFAIPQVFGIEGYNMLFSGDAERTGINISAIHRNLTKYFSRGGVIAILSIFIIFKNVCRKKIDFYQMWGILSLVTLMSIISYLPWYLLYFIPAFGVVISREIKNNPIDKFMLSLIIISSLAYSVYFPYSQYDKYIGDADEILGMVEAYNNSKIMVIARLGETFGNAMYDFPYFAIVTPQNGFHNSTEYYGVKQQTLEKDNMKCLIYNYDNQSCIPEPLHLLNSSERYLPPIARTDKQWDGEFDVIIAEEPYAKVIMEIAPEYKAEYITKNEVYYVLSK